MLKPSLNSRAVLLIALLLAALTAFLVYRYLQQSPVQTTAAVPMARMVVAVRDIPANATIAANMVAVHEIPQDYRTPGTTGNVKDVVGTVAMVELYSGEPILLARLYKGQAGASLQYLIPKGMRALTIAVNNLDSFNGMLRAGDRVDVLAILPSTITQLPQPVVATVLQNIAILATGTQTDADSKDAKNFGTVTLLVTPQQAEEAVYVVDVLKSRMTLRGAGDADTPPVPVYRPDQLLELIK